jgi:hypothetical protein
VNLAITSIQRNRNPWIVEWLAFHMLVGFNQFRIYAHKTNDGMTQTLLRLARHYPITVHAIDMDHAPQLQAYQHAYTTYGGQADWMAFIDGDEFLFPTAHATMAEALASFDGQALSALGAYWMCYGSSGHLEEPQGLVLENYRRHSRLDFDQNRHVKTIVRGRQSGVVATTCHVFQTPHGTFDEQMRPITYGWMPQYAPSHERLRINHYIVQSWQFFTQTKQGIGMPCDAAPTHVRPTAWFRQHDRNECDDGASWNFLIPLKLKVRELQQVAALPLAA